MKSIVILLSFVATFASLAAEAQTANVRVERRLIMSSRSAGRGLFTEVADGKTLGFVDCKMIDARAKHVDYSMDCTKVGDGVLPIKSEAELQSFDEQMSAMVKREMDIKQVKSPTEHAVWAFMVPEMSMFVGMAGLTYVAYEIDPFNRQGMRFQRLANTLEYPLFNYERMFNGRFTVLHAIPTLITIGAMVYTIYKFNQVRSEARISGETLEDMLSYKNPDLATKLTGDEISSAYEMIEDIIRDIFEYRKHA